ncbi:hypothetical protein SELMODRAFT_426590 [Selaginella moellendorffii]|uniref:PRMT5 TIM barrel domain-containing protein n=1 Tax=Selaginella moellendorffii TaxID=88036 RepID=D8SWV6_SELML|nr:hypothetical protein SELMODRAFT_426590 [Selaginella moellendorffii]
MSLSLDGDDDIARPDSELVLKKELSWAAHLSVQACLFPTPKVFGCANYARLPLQFEEAELKMLHICSQSHQSPITMLFNRSVQVIESFHSVGAFEYAEVCV